ncbi:MAG: esterase [Acidimicrobiaceae bacterium]|nr:esterase [Acidimicrobiaceae bacterium]
MSGTSDEGRSVGAGVVSGELRRITVAEGVALSVRIRAGRSDAVPFLLVHGLASNARMWDGVADRLAELGHPSAAVDQRGHGLSDKPDAGYDFATITDDLVSLIGQLGWDRPVVAGQSWGGNVVLELGWRFPQQVRGIVCVDGGTIELADRFASWEACREALTPPALVGTPAAKLEAMFRRMHPDWPESGIAGSLANFEVRPDGTVAPWLSLDRHLQILRGLWEHRPSQRYPQIQVPVLLVPAGPGGDAADPEKRSVIEAAERAIPRARTHWMAGDHDIHAQHPVEMADLVAEQVVEGFFA